MSSCEESGTEKETLHSIKKSSPSSTSNSPDSSPSSSKPSRDNLVNSDEECETNELKPLPPGYLSALTPDGVLTPPNDSEICKNGTYDDGRTGKSNGRLAFFKEGVLCLELSHEDEGNTTKWLKIKTRSTFRNVVRVTKEVTIPCPSAVPPPMFTSPSSLCHGVLSSSHVESCTSHSMSDDGSSLISAESPKLKDRSWRKQLVPQRSVSSSLQFFMKPASCFHKIKRQNRTRIQTEALVRNRRRPYALPDFLNVLSSSSSGDNDNKDVCTCGIDGVKSRHLLEGTSDISFKATGNGKCKLKLEDLIIKLTLEVEEKAPLIRKTSDDNSHPLVFEPRIVSPSKSKSNNHSRVLPRKRSLKEVEAEELAPHFRPIKKNSSKVSEKTILTVPGVGNVCAKVTPVPMSLSNSNNISKSLLNYSRSSAPTTAYTHDASDGSNVDMSGSPSSGDSNRSSTSNGNANMHESVGNVKRSRNTSRVKRSSPPCSILKPIVKPVQHATKNADSNASNVHDHERGDQAINRSRRASSPSSEEKEDTLSPEEQQQFQQQAMSKAISYTINSLLGNGNSSIVGSQNDNRTVDARRAISKVSNHKTSKSNKSSDVLGSGTALHGSLFGINEQDQNSFLRHLLDTSDPIPSSTASSVSPPTISNKIGHSLPKTLDRSAINSVNKTRSSSIAKSRNSTKLVRSSFGTSSSRNNSSVHASAVRPDIVSKVVPAAMPVSAVVGESGQNMSQYGYLVHSHQRAEILSPPVTATTFQQHHYAPLLPAHFMPKILPHPYLGQFPAPNFTHLEYRGETALNLSQRGENWSLSNQNSYDRASNGPQDLSMRRGSSPYDDMDSSSINSDIPLNLCKRSRPN